MIILGDNAQLNGLDFGFESVGSPIPFVTASYFFLEDHYIGGIYYPAGTTGSTHPVFGTLPFNWVPSPNVDPLNTPAVNAFYAAGPRDQGIARTQFTTLPVNMPVTFWKQIAPNLYALTGLGSNQAAYPPIYAVLVHPVQNLPT